MTETVARPEWAARMDEPVANLFAWFSEMTRTQPVGFDPAIRAWQVFGYEQAQQVLTDPTFSADVAAVGRAAGMDTSRPQVLDRLTTASFFTMDHATHNKFRALVKRTFTPRFIARMDDRIGQIAAGILDEVHGTDGFDLLDRVARPLPMTVLCELLGVPHDDRRAFEGWAEILLTGGGGDQALLEARLVEFEKYLHEHVRACRRAGGEDLISKLTEATVDGEPLGDDVVVSLAAVMLLAGHNTTTMLLGNLVVCLDEHPEAAAEVRADRSLLPSAIEEVFRYRPPLPRALRLSTRETEVDGHTIEAGQPVVVWTGAGNWDAAVFDVPERFDIRRSPNRHLGFGHGVHFCLGAQLARSVARIAMSTLFDHCADIQVNRERPLEYRAPRVNLGVSALPIDVRWH